MPNWRHSNTRIHGSMLRRSYCHWFQPLGACGVRPGGGTAGVQINMLNFDADGNPSYEFSGKDFPSPATHAILIK